MQRACIVKAKAVCVQRCVYKYCVISDRSNPALMLCSSARRLRAIECPPPPPLSVFLHVPVCVLACAFASVHGCTNTPTRTGTLGSFVSTAWEAGYSSAKKQEPLILLRISEEAQRGGQGRGQRCSAGDAPGAPKGMPWDPRGPFQLWEFALLWEVKGGVMQPEVIWAFKKVCGVWRWHPEGPWRSGRGEGSQPASQEYIKPLRKQSVPCLKMQR